MWPFTRRYRDAVHVEYFDADTAARTGQVMMPIDKLPQSFEADTTLKRNGRDYAVVRADPVTAEEFRRTGKLRLVIREVKIERMDPREILFSLPTIYGSVAPIAEGSSKLGRNVIEIHEDDYRQREFVSLAQQEEIDRHLEAIRRIYAEQREGYGFRAIHVREGLVSPLAPATPRIDEVISAAGAGATRLDGLAYHRVAGVAADVIVLRMLCGIELYGTVQDDRFTTLCLTHARPNNAPLASAIAPLIELARRHELCLVDWQRAQQIGCDDMLAYFEELR